TERLKSGCQTPCRVHELRYGARIGPGRGPPGRRAVKGVDITLVPLAQLQHELHIIPSDRIQAVAGGRAWLRGSAGGEGQRENGGEQGAKQGHGLTMTASWLRRKWSRASRQIHPKRTNPSFFEISCASLRVNG